MAKTLANYRDETRRAFDDDSIIAAFPMWFEDAPTITPRPDHTGAAASLGQYITPVLGLVAAAGLGLVRVGRQLARRGRPDERGALTHETGSVLFVLRPTQIDVHSLEIGERSGGKHLHTLTPHEHPVRLLRVGASGERRVAFGHTQWTVRRRHAKAFVQHIDAMGFHIAPDER